MRLILFLILASAPRAYATCEEDLSIDQRYAQILKTHAAQSRDVGRALTQLMNDTFAPTVRQVSAYALTLSPEQIAESARRLKALGEPTAAKMKDIAGARALGFDGGFSASEYLFTGNYAYTQHNRALIRRLVVAVEVFAEAGRIPVDQNPDPRFASDTIFLTERSFTMGDPQLTIAIGADSLILAVSALTADPVGELTPEEVFEAIMATRQKGASLMLMYSLMLPPALQGQNGGRAYLRNPLVQQADGLLSFTSHFKEFHKKHRELFARRESEAFEFGFGCPVAHCAPGAAQPALQDFFDATMYVYRNLPVDL